MLGRYQSNIPKKFTIFVIVLFCFTLNVRGTDPTTAPTDPTAAPTDPTAAPTGPTAAPTGPTAAPTGPTAAPTISTEPQSPATSEPFTDPTISENTELSTITTDVVTSNGPTTIITPSPSCYPDKFPFGDRCITPGENGGVVITAFILSILSFIGVVGATSYLLFFRKFLSRGKGGMLSNADHEMQVYPKGNHNSRQAASYSLQGDSPRNSMKKTGKIAGAYAAPKPAKANPVRAPQPKLVIDDDDQF